MAENDNNNDLSLNFGIEDTIEKRMGIGSTELLSSLMSPETATADPKEITKIVKEVEQSVEKVDDKQRGKEIVQKDNIDQKLTDQDRLKNFLGDTTEDDDDTDDVEEKNDNTDIIEKDKNSSKDNNENDNIDEEVTQLVALTRDLEKLGVFVKEEGEEEIDIKTPQDFLDRFNGEKKKGAIEIVNKFIGQFGEDYQEAFEAIYVKGVNPKDYWNVYNSITDFTSLDLSVEENQVLVMKKALTDEGLEPEDVLDEIDKLKNYGDLEAAATKRHKVLVKRDAIKLQQMQQEAEHKLQQNAAIRNQYIQNVRGVIQEKLKTKEFDGIPINPKLANELQDFLLVEGWVTPSGEKLTEFDKTILELKRPENHAQKVKLALILKIMEKDPTLSTIQKAGLTKKSDKLFEEVTRQGNNRKPSNTQDKPSSWFK